MASPATNPLLLTAISSRPRQHGLKASSTVKTDLSIDSLCDVCRGVDLEKLLTRPQFNNQNFFLSPPEPRDTLEYVSWDFKELRKSTHCLLCQFLYLAISINEQPDLQKDLLVVWPQPIAEYKHYGLPITWSYLLWGWTSCFRNTTRPEPFTELPKMLGWQLHIAIMSSSSDPEQPDSGAADGVIKATQVTQTGGTRSNEPEDHQIQKSHPSRLRDSTGYVSHRSSHQAGEQSYLTCSRDLFHIRSGLSSIFGNSLANGIISSVCIQLQGRSSTGFMGPLEFITSEYETANMMKCRGINTDQANLATALHWQQFCSVHHPPFCEPLKWAGISSSPFKLRVIDVSRNCVVEAPPNCLYAALSYCWVSASTICARQGQEFTHPGALSLKSLNRLSLRMPRTISDAMVVCKSLGLRFLWVDCLCIVQDGTDKQAQLNGMGYIYSGAQCTIVAGHGDDADAGLPGISGTSRRRQHFQTQIGNLKLSTAPRNAATALQKSTWYARAWTFQELVLSKRLLVFTEEQMLFFCVRGAFREDLHLEGNNGSVSDVQHLGSFMETHIQLTGRTPNLDKLGDEPKLCQAAVRNYEYFLASYLCRDLTYETDILDAFSGIFDALVSYIGPFRWGLPIYCSTEIFAWHSADRFPLSRRGGFPSWSWAGWKGYMKQVVFGDRIKTRDAFIPPSDIRFASRDPQIFVFAEQGRLIPIEHATCFHDAERISEGGAQSFTPPPIEPSVMTDLANMSIDHLIVFYADCVFLPVSRIPSGPEDDVYTVEGMETYHISLDPAWRNEQADVLEFMLVPFYRMFYRVILIVRHGPVCYRIQAVQESVADWHFFHLTQRKLIIFG